ncbi:glycerophosphodiester phosphodiesterase [Paenarthrobacter sp. NPDC089714]|uniref:glycerophosphodiester phosphodiesterase n=1 Tax=Paenarthrobacter sp. NPDC089714 TaxID=3364377 RepID=UPI0037F11955
MIEIQGHRGVLATRHGNTLAGFVEALRLGVGAIEVDIWLTADGQLALRHDAVVGSLDIREALLREAAVEIHAATTTSVDVESRTPTLEELLALLRFAGAGEVVLDIEVKTDNAPWNDYGQTMVAALAKVLKAHEHEQALRVRSFDPQIIRAMAAMLPGIPMVALCREVAIASLGLYPFEPFALIEAALATGASAVAPEVGLLTSELVARAHTAGLAVYPWTLVTAQQIVEAVGLGVEGVCVNDVSMARESLAGLGLELPVSRPIALPMLESGRLW